MDMSLLLSPVIAFLIYMLLAGALTLLGRLLSGPGGPSTPEKLAIYASGEAGPSYQAAPGYRQFFVVALFFAVLHLGILITCSGGLDAVTGAYLGGLILVLVALILG